ncbi:MAG: DNA translocase FtsK 4TM domain-containing protein [Deltaproteobacteria bacterium]
MVSARKNKKTNRNKSVRLSDERFRKITGILLILVSFYLLIAFTSYFISWKVDQDKVLKFSTDMLFNNELTVSNWLGRLGALVSNAFIYWGFGVPSLLFVLIFFRLGFVILFRKSFSSFLVFLTNCFYIIAFSSVLLSYFLGQQEFSWGGAFGTSVNQWMVKFIGSVGLLLLLIFILAVVLTWLFNPKFETMKFSTGNLNLNFPVVFFRNRFGAGTGQPADAVGNPDEKESVLPDFIPNWRRDEEENSAIDFDIDKNKIEVDPVAIDTEDFDINYPQHSDGLEKIVIPASNESIDLISKDDFDTIKVITDNDEEVFIEPYDPMKELSNYVFPDVELLRDYDSENITIDRAELEANKDQIVNTLRNYKIEIVKIRATIGPSVTLYEIIPAPGIKISKIKSLENDIALSLAALGIRIIAPIPGKGTIGIEVPNQNKQTVGLKDILKSKKFSESNMDLPIALGKTVSNEVFIADLAKMPHLLVAGATGQGKSVGINSIIVSLLYKKHPSEVKFILIDPKKVELFPYNGMEKHFLGFLPDEKEAIVTETEKVVYTLNSLIIEMEDRYNLLKNAKTRNIKEYNAKYRERRLNPKNGHRFLPYIVLVIDEFADLIMTAGKEVELPIARLAQLSRAVGIHLVLATQRPSVNIITGVIKANFPARIAFKVASKVDSRTILDTGGADQLVGRGDMLISLGGASILRVQGAFIDTAEIENVVDHIKHQQGYSEPFYLPEYKTDDDMDYSSLNYNDLDEMFVDAAKIIIAEQYGSTSLLQRKMQIGYNRAGRIVDQMENLGMVGPSKGSKPREVLVYSEAELMEILNRLKTKS